MTQELFKAYKCREAILKARSDQRRYVMAQAVRGIAAIEDAFGTNAGADIRVRCWEQPYFVPDPAALELLRFLHTSFRTARAIRRVPRVFGNAA